MLSFVIPSIRKLGSCWLLLLIAFVVGNDRIAEATCGDHLGRHSQESLQLPFNETKIPAHAPVFPTCTGPHCHRQAPIPFVPQDHLISRVTDAILTVAVDLLCVDGNLLRSRGEISDISGVTTRIFRPPRVDVTFLHESMGIGD